MIKPLVDDERERLRVLEAAEKRRARRRARRADREASDHADMLSRQIRAHARRVGSADYVDLGRLVELSREMDQAIVDAVRLQREAGASWHTIGLGLGTTRQAAQHAYGRRLRAV